MRVHLRLSGQIDPHVISYLGWAMMVYVCKTGWGSELYCVSIISFCKEIGSVYIETSKESNESLCINCQISALGKE